MAEVTQKKVLKIARVLGDGAAPEMMTKATQVMRKALGLFEGVDLEVIDILMGWAAWKEFGDTFPESEFKKADDIGTLFFGGVGDFEYDETIGKMYPHMKPEARCLLPIRDRWQLDVNERPFINLPQVRHLSTIKNEFFPDSDATYVWHFLRYLLKDSYFGTQDMRKLGLSHPDFKLKSEVTGLEDRVAEAAYYDSSLVFYFLYAFRRARLLKLPVICIDKANVSARYTYWRKLFEEVAQCFPDIKVHYQYVDSANALWRTPHLLHGVIVCGNEHGDILSDGAANMYGGMGMMYSASISSRKHNAKAMFESGAGTAPTLKGKNVANPLGRILTAALLLEHRGFTTAAKAIFSAVNLVLALGYCTADMKTKSTKKSMVLGTEEMTIEVMKNLEDLDLAA